MKIDDIKDMNDLDTFLKFMKEVDLDNMRKSELARLYGKMYSSRLRTNTTKDELLRLLRECENDILRTKSLARQIQIPGGVNTSTNPLK